MVKQISQFNPGDTIYFIEGGWNQVVGTILGKDTEGVSVWATSLTFGAEEADGLFLPPTTLVAKWQFNVPQILNQ